jgi:hypothetical protein
LSAVVPPGDAAAEDSAKFGSACERQLNGKKRAVKGMEFLKSAFMFFRYTRFPPGTALP